MDHQTGYAFMWDGSTWVMFASSGPEPEIMFTAPTKEQLEKYPALKKSWEEFLIIKRLLGV